MTRRLPAALLLLIAPIALAADHMDGPAATADPAADITDLFAWTSTDGARLNLVLDVFPGATSTAKFSNAVQYVFHTTSHSAFGAASPAATASCASSPACARTRSSSTSTASSTPWPT